MSEIPTSGQSPSPSDVVEFGCIQCGRQLRISREAAAGVVKCPACGHVQRPAESNSPTRPAAAIPPTATPAVNVQRPVDSPPAASAPVVSQPPVTNPSAQAPATTPVPATPASAVVNVTPRLSIDEITAAGERETETQALFFRILEQVSKIYVGQDELVLGTLVALFSSGHVLIESVPGLGKTLFVRTLGTGAGLRFRPHSVHGRPDAVGHHRRPNLRYEDSGVSLSTRPRVHAVVVGRRDQPVARQDTCRTAGDHAGVPSHRRWHESCNCNVRFWCWRRRIRSSPKGHTICRRLSWIASCSN